MSIIENSTTELKREYTADIVKTVIAFANTNGGNIYIGIDNDKQVIGISDIDGTMLQASNSIRDGIKPDVTLFVDYQQEVIEGKAVILVTVQKGTACPYYLTGKGIRPEGVYVRQGASSVPATETTILHMIKETDGERYEDVRALNQDLTFTYAQTVFAEKDIQFAQSQQKTLGIINGDGIYTNLGLLISDQCIHTIKLAVFEGTEKLQFKDRREYSGSLLKQLNEVFEFIERYNRTRSDINGLYRVDKRDYPVEAVREALLNALVHRDYSFSDSTLISVFDDRIELVSIGGLVRGITFDDMMLGISVARNRNLANIFYRLNLIEAYGTGMPKILRSYQNSPVKPQIEVSDNAFKITLPNINEAPQRSVLSDNEQIVLKLFEDREFIVRKDVESALNISQSMAVNILKSLVVKGELLVVGQGKNTQYVYSKGAK